MARILLADDDAAILQSVSILLTQAGHTVFRARNGVEAMEYMKWERFDVFITDIIMPDKEGLETIEQVRKNHPQLKIIAMSGGGFLRPADYLKIASRLGADRTLSKPCSGADLLRTVEELLAP